MCKLNLDTGKNESGYVGLSGIIWAYESFPILLLSNKILVIR